ncbi:bifunctional (p)ppGpp synthetase/guanosine-3',5'-bis(diphosphate) 3'-pyrophosphohydrolase [Chitinophaga lutea]|uniref:Bifunctional (P)ppGpp synthetase/guanosine-3',5'-bis(Diphosphate) 3'-pyrophosphohydrolase n=1 Tax=Chitinophaga lutea TaxID=2488634 RepID=A0A3N4PZD0_9BACT|nr:bifunctional (p)ppGpp synthetase/guanosine-3',5'-bis(diphosphate) 3'-pyrophosphohydrolase [Chitinophaga lutea]RPE14102.1 bifunctional (p)ppGpp synthetase/guanosine-3',5'-bis(diphosphate) 3'-pyrophosphohydrolase [Chitinophaga lutea]
METVTVQKYNLDEEQEKKEIVRHYRALLRALKPRLKKGDRELVRTAFEMAADAHKDMRRKSGEPYILHPLAVAQITVEEIGLGVRSAICALLHDTVEDTEVTLEDVEREFGTEIAHIVNGLTKISTVIDSSTSTAQAENFKKILLTLADDPRVILIKLADRLHNMRTLDSMSREKQLKIASETVFIYAPLAHRLGLYIIKSEMEDLAMKYTEQDQYREIARRLKETKRERTRYINEFIKPIKEVLQEEGFQFEIYGRPKSIHSIWNKIKTKGVQFEEVYDLFAIRIILDSALDKEKADCWKVYSIITDFYHPSPERTRDWLSNPKSNGYEALHVTVMGPNGKWVEVQIRSKRMNDYAEKGVAAHWRYKEGNQSVQESKFEQWFSQIREILNSPDSNTLDFLADFKSNLFTEEIYVYTPKGDLKILPVGSTALDFAYSIHSAVGNKCIGAKVNYKLVPLSHKLRSGDQVEIITSNKQKPSEDWLNFVLTAKAKSKIKDALKEEKRKVAMDGKELLERKLDHMKASASQYNINELVQFYKQPSPLDLYYQIAVKNIDLKELKQFNVLGDKLEAPKPVKLPELPAEEPHKQTSKKDAELIIFGESSDKIAYKLANCCRPIPGDDVFGFITASEGLKIHRTNCPNAAQLLSHYGHRVVKTKWVKNREISFLTGLRIVGMDDVGVIHKITNIISGELKINIAGLTIESREGLFEGLIKVFVHDKDELEELVQRLKGLDGIQSVSRLED